MEQVNHFPIIPRTDAEYEQAVDYMIAELKKLHEQIADEHQEIVQLREESRATLTRRKRMVDDVAKIL